MEEGTKQKHKDVDGGYAWVILTCAFSAFGLGNGFRQTFGILYPEILDRYQAGQLRTSWIITIQVLHWGLMGVFVGLVIQKYGGGVAIYLGSLTAAGKTSLIFDGSRYTLGKSGFIMSAFSPDVSVLYVTLGVLNGTSQVLLYMGSASILYYYFHDKKGLATSIFATGQPVMGMIMTVVTPHLLETYGYKGTLCILGAFSLNGLPLGMLIRNPRYLQQKDERQNEVLEMKDPLKDPVKDPVKKSEKEQENDEKSKLLACAECRSTDEQGENVSKDASQPKMFGLHLLKNWMFVMFLMSASLSNLSMDSLHWFIPDRAIEIGFSKQHAALTLTVANVANIFSRLFFGILTSDKFFYHAIMFVVYNLLSGFNSILVVFCNSFWTYMVFSAIFGLLRGLFIIYELLLMVDIVGRDQVHLGYGLTLTTSGILYLISIPTFGHLNEVTESYSTTFVLYGSCEVIGGLFLVTVPIYLCLKKVTTNE